MKCCNFSVLLINIREENGKYTVLYFDESLNIAGEHQRIGHVELEDDAMVEQRKEGRDLDADVEEHRHRHELGIEYIEPISPKNVSERHETAALLRIVKVAHLNWWRESVSAASRGRAMRT